MLWAVYATLSQLPVVMIYEASTEWMKMFGGVECLLKDTHKQPELDSFQS